MSGGSLDYFYYKLEDHVGEFRDKELDDLVKDLAELFHDREWYLSGDTSLGNWRESRDAFKAKWFTEHGRQERIEKYLDEIRAEVRETFGYSENRCSNCKHNVKECGKYGDYVECELLNSAVSHRSDSCERFERRTDE